MNNIVIIGSGGFGREVAWLIEDINAVNKQWDLLGFVDDNHVGEIINGYPVLGNLDWLKDQKLNVVCAVGDPTTKKIIMKKLESSKNIYPILIHPSVIMSKLVNIGHGTIICAGNILTVNITIGNHVIINLDSTIGHDAIINDYCTILPSVNISGNVVLEERVSVGTGSQVIQGLSIGKNTTIGAGSVVVKNIASNVVAVGLPARPIKEIEDRMDSI